MYTVASATGYDTLASVAGYDGDGQSCSSSLVQSPYGARIQLDNPLQLLRNPLQLQHETQQSLRKRESEVPLEQRERAELQHRSDQSGGGGGRRQDSGQSKTVFKSCAMTSEMSPVTTPFCANSVILHGRDQSVSHACSAAAHVSPPTQYSSSTADLKLSVVGGCDAHSSSFLPSSVIVRRRTSPVQDMTGPRIERTQATRETVQNGWNSNDSYDLRMHKCNPALLGVGLHHQHQSELTVNVGLSSQQQQTVILRNQQCQLLGSVVPQQQQRLNKSSMQLGSLTAHQPQCLSTQPPHQLQLGVASQHVVMQQRLPSQLLGMSAQQQLGLSAQQQLGLSMH